VAVSTDAARARPVEREVKLQAAPGFHLPDLSNILEGVTAGPETEGRMETTYYDTPDLRLARWGLSLRHRQREGWTLKLPGSSNGSVLSRGELTFEGVSRRPPPEVTRLLRAYVRGAQLQPVARLSTWRRRVSLFSAQGRRLAEVVDDEVSVLSGRRVAARFREVEVELDQGGEPILQQLLWVLRGAGAGLADQTPKHLRALGPAAHEPPEVAARPLGPLATGADVVANALASAVSAILEHDPGIRLGGDPEDVHQARVGTRRLRSHLRTFGPLLNSDWAEDLRMELGWLATELGAVRDREVLLERLQQLSGRLPGADARQATYLGAQLRASIDAGRADLMRALDSQRYIDLLERLVAAANQPEVTEEAMLPAGRVVPGLARRPWRQLRRAIRALPENPPDQELHRCRILAKRARYAAEAVAPAAGQDALRFAKAAAGLQTVLGDHQDSVNAQVWLRERAGRGRRAFVAGELAAMELVRAEESRRAWPAAWKKLDSRRLHSWMTDGT
jgi:CHAD domain-containing protein